MISFKSSMNCRTLPEYVRNESFHNIPNIGRKQSVVLNTLIDLGEGTNWDVADRLGWSINCVTGRINELYRKNVVVVAGTKLNPKTNKQNVVWRKK